MPSPVMALRTLRNNKDQLLRKAHHRPQVGEKSEHMLGRPLKSAREPMLHLEVSPQLAVPMAHTHSNLRLWDTSSRHMAPTLVLSKPHH